MKKVIESSGCPFRQSWLLWYFLFFFAKQAAKQRNQKNFWINEKGYWTTELSISSIMIYCSIFCFSSQSKLRSSVSKSIGWSPMKKNNQHKGTSPERAVSKVILFLNKKALKINFYDYLKNGWVNWTKRFSMKGIWTLIFKMLE